MIKLLVETKGRFQLMDLTHLGQIVRAQRPCVVESSNFIQDRIGRNQIRVLSELKPHATDEDFLGYHKEAEGETQLAVDSFLSEFGTEAVEKEGQTSKGEDQAGKGRGRGRAKPKTDETE